MSSHRKTWHIITGEYPPQPGGVSDYTRLVACGLAAAGEDVHVWAPHCDSPPIPDVGVTVHRLPDHFGVRSLRILGAALNSWPRPSRILVQYVPHAFGWKAMNVNFCRWLTCRRQPVWVFFHEVAYAWQRGDPYKHYFLSRVNEKMAGWAANAAERVFVSIPGWIKTLHRIAPSIKKSTWLPIPSTLPTENTPGAAQKQRDRLGIARPCPLIGHFGTYGQFVTRLLTPLVAELLTRNPSFHFLLMGRNSDAYAKTNRDWATRVHATGEACAEVIGTSVAACDVLLQPYPDGISCRRTSVMAGLALGKPVVSTFGDLSEPFWRDSNAVKLGAADRPEELIPLVEELLNDPKQRAAMGEEGRRLYRENFSIERTIDVLLGRAPSLPFPTESS